MSIDRSQPIGSILAGGKLCSFQRTARLDALRDEARRLRRWARDLVAVPGRTTNAEDRTPRKRPHRPTNH